MCFKQAIDHFVAFKRVLINILWQWTFLDVADAI